jgi:phosphatidylinositol-3-phosphatase
MRALLPLALAVSLTVGEPLPAVALEGAASAPTAQASAADAPDGRVPPLVHVLVVILENHSYDETRSLPYTASLIARSASFANSFAIAHPSQPNYLALWAASTMDVGDDSCPPHGSPYAVENLGHACEVAGLRWRSYAEDLPHVASDTCRAAGKRYTRKHDPWTDFSNLSHDNERTYADLAADIANDSLPNLAFVIPNNCHNSHDKDCNAAVADAWLAANMPAMLQAVGPRGLVILTWDEDDGSADNRILTVFAGDRVKPNVVSRRWISHFSIVHTISAALGLPVFANAITDSAITDVWRADPLTNGLGTDAPASLGTAVRDPANGHIFCALELARRADVRAAIFDAGGREVREIARGAREGRIAVEWDGRDASGMRAPPGPYLLRVFIDGKTLERRIERQP